MKWVGIGAALALCPPLGLALLLLSMGHGRPGEVSPVAPAPVGAMSPERAGKVSRAPVDWTQMEAYKKRDRV